MNTSFRSKKICKTSENTSFISHIIFICENKNESKQSKNLERNSKLVNEWALLATLAPQKQKKNQTKSKLANKFKTHERVRSTRSVKIQANRNKAKHTQTKQKFGSKPKIRNQACSAR